MILILMENGISRFNSFSLTQCKVMWFDRGVFWILVLIGMEKTTQEEIHRDVQRNHGMEEGSSGKGTGYVQPCPPRRSSECSIVLNVLCMLSMSYTPPLFPNSE